MFCHSATRRAKSLVVPSFALSLVLALYPVTATAATVTWNGGDFNWTSPDTNSFSATYNNGDAVLFTPTGGGTITIQAGGVSPASMTFAPTNGGFTFQGGDITGSAFIDYDKDHGTTFSGGDASGNYNFTGGVTIRHGGAQATYNPTAVAAHYFGTNTIKLGVLPNPSAGGGGGRFNFNTGNTAGVTLTNNFEVGPNGGTVAGSGYTGTFTLNGNLTIGSGTTNFGAPTVLTADRTIFTGQQGATISSTSITGATRSLTVSNNGANPDWVTNITGTGGWNVKDFVYNAGATNRANVNISGAVPTSFFSGIIANNGRVIINGGGVKFAPTSGTTIDVGFNLVLNANTAGLGTGLIDASQLNINSGGSAGGNGTYAYRAGLGGASNFTLNTNITVNNGGTIRPGSSAGIMTVTGNTTFNAGSTLDMEVTGGGAVAGTDYDRLAVVGNVNGLSNSALVVTFAPGLQFSDLSGDVLTLITSANNLTGSAFTSITYVNAPFFFAKVTYGNGFVTLSDFNPVPEPSTFALLGLGIVGVAVKARRRRQRAA